MIRILLISMVLMLGCNSDNLEQTIKEAESQYTTMLLEQHSQRALSDQAGYIANLWLRKGVEVKYTEWSNISYEHYQYREPFELDEGTNALAD